MSRPSTMRARRRNRTMRMGMSRLLGGELEDEEQTDPEKREEMPVDGGEAREQGRPHAEETALRPEGHRPQEQQPTEHVDCVRPRQDVEEGAVHRGFGSHAALPPEYPG